MFHLKPTNVGIKLNLQFIILLLFNKKYKQLQLVCADSFWVVGWSQIFWKIQFIFYVYMNETAKRAKTILKSNIFFAVLRDIRKYFLILRFSHFICIAEWTLKDDQKEIIAFNTKQQILFLCAIEIHRSTWNIVR